MCCNTKVLHEARWLIPSSMLVNAAITVTIILIAAVLARNLPLAVPFLNYGMMAAVPLYLRWRPHWLAISAAPIITLALAALHVRKQLFHISTAGAFLGLACLCLMALTVEWSSTNRRVRMYDLAIAA